MEGLILDEVVAFNESLTKDAGKRLNLRHRFNISVINALWTIISGKRVALDDPELLKLVHIVDEMTVKAGKRKLIDAFPWMRHIIPKASGWQDLTEAMSLILNFIENTMNPHIASYNVEGRYIQNALLAESEP